MILWEKQRDNFKNLEDIDSIDEAAENLYSSMEREHKHYISPETEFWGHCSNLQAWYENNRGGIPAQLFK